MLDWISLRGRPIRPRSPPSSRSAAAFEIVMIAVVVDAEDARGHPRQHRLDEGAPLVIERVRLDETGLLAQEFGGHLVERVAKMAEVSVGTAGRHLDMEIAGRDLVGRADQAADRADQPIGEGQSKPDRREQHGERQHHEHGREGELEAVAVEPRSAPTSLETRAASSVTLAVKGSNAARRVEELAVGLGDRANGDENIAGPEKPGRRVSPFTASWKSDGSGLAISLGSEPFREMIDRSVASHQRGGVETERLGPRTEIVLELRGIRLELHARCARDRRRSAPRRAGARGTGHSP